MSPEEQFEADYAQGRRGGLIAARQIVSTIRNSPKHVAGNSDVWDLLREIDDRLAQAIDAARLHDGGSHIRCHPQDCEDAARTIADQFIAEHGDYIRS